MSPLAWGRVAFVVGAIVQLFLLVRRWRLGDDDDWWAVVFAAVAFALGLLPSRGEPPYDAQFHVLGSTAFSVGVFAIMMRKKILPPLNEQAIFYLTLVNAYLIAESVRRPTTFTWIWLWVSALPTLIATLSAFTSQKLHPSWRIALYVWYLTMIIVLCIASFTMKGLVGSFGEDAFAASPVTALLTGMVFAYLAVHVAYVLDFLPLPRRGQSYGDRMKDWGEFAGLMQKRFTKYQMPMRHTVVILIVQGALYLSNGLFGYAQPAEMVHASLVLLPGLYAGLIPGPVIEEKPGRLPGVPAIEPLPRKKRGSRHHHHRHPS